MAKEMSVSLALGLTIEALKAGRGAKYGYDLFTAEVATEAAIRFAGEGESADQVVRREYWRHFEEAAWVLCTRGILRLGVRNLGDQSTSDGGYSLTSQAQDKLSRLDGASLLVLQSDSLSQTLSGFESRFGAGFRQRALEAVNCRDVGAIFAACALAGAAAEAVLIALAVAKSKDAEAVQRKYRASDGRRQILNLVSGGSKEHIRQALKVGRK